METDSKDPQKRKNLNKKILITASIIFILLIIISVAGDEMSSKNTNQINPTPTTGGNTLNVNDINQFPELKSILSEKTNDSSPRPRYRYFFYNQENKYLVVEFNMDRNFTEKLTTEGVIMEMSKMYEAVYHGKHLPIDTVTISAWGQTIDKYGNNNDAKFATTKLTKDVADKINWNQDKSILELNIIPKLWEVFFGQDQLDKFQ